MEASISIEMMDNNSIIEIIKAFQKIGWKIYNTDVRVELMSDDYSWDSYNITCNELYELLIEKEKRGEIIGLNFFYEKGNEGFSLFADDSNKLLLSLDIYRRTIKNNYTDMTWYIQNIVNKLIYEDVRILTYSAVDYCD